MAILNPNDWLDYSVLGNTATEWVISAGVFTVALFVLWIARSLISRRLHALAVRSDLQALHIAETVARATRGWFLFLLASFIGSRYLEIDAGIELWLARATIVVALLQLGLWLSAGVGRFIDARRQRDLEEHPDGVAAMDILSFIARVAIWSLVVLAVLDNLGVNITTLIAGLGVGGIAIALAAQKILGDLFASLSIVLDKPFVVGDFLIIDDLLGTVESVGIKTTRMRSLSGEQLVFSNNDLLSSRIRNYGRMAERRVVFSIGVTYQTPADKLGQIPAMLRQAVEAEADVRFDRAHFQRYGDFALIFEIVYHVLSADYARYMDIQQGINLRIYEDLHAAGIEFAYPTQTLYVNRIE